MILEKVKFRINTWLGYKVLCAIKSFMCRRDRASCRNIKTVVAEHFCDKALGIETSSFLSFEDTPQRFAEGVFQDGRRYQPLAYAKFGKILERMRLREEDVFFELGCGKGRVVFLAAQQPVRKVVGVELNQELVDAARRNLSTARVKVPVDIIHADAACVDVNEGTVFFFYNPFGAETLAVVLGRIRESLTVSPRKVRIVYVNAVHADVVSAQEWLRLTEGVVGRDFCVVWESL